MHQRNIQLVIFNTWYFEVRSTNHTRSIIPWYDVTCLTSTAVTVISEVFVITPMTSSDDGSYRVLLPAILVPYIPVYVYALRVPNKQTNELVYRRQQQQWYLGVGRWQSPAMQHSARCLCVASSFTTLPVPTLPVLQTA